MARGRHQHHSNRHCGLLLTAAWLLFLSLSVMVRSRTATAAATALRKPTTGQHGLATKQHQAGQQWQQAEAVVTAGNDAGVAAPVPAPCRELGKAVRQGPTAGPHAADRQSLQQSSDTPAADGHGPAASSGSSSSSSSSSSRRRSKQRSRNISWQRISRNDSSSSSSGGHSRRRNEVGQDAVKYSSSSSSNSNSPMRQPAAAGVASRATAAAAAGAAAAVNALSTPVRSILTLQLPPSAAASAGASTAASSAALAEPAAAASAAAAADDSLQYVTVTAKNQCRFCQQLFLLVRFLPVAGPTTSSSSGWVSQGYFVLKRNQVKKVLATQASSYQLYAYCGRTDGGGWIEWKGGLLKPVAVPVPGSSSSPPQCTDIPFVQRQLPQATAAAALVLRCSRTAGLVGPPVPANAAGASAAAAAAGAASAGSGASAAVDGSGGSSSSSSSGGREQDLLEGEASSVVAAAGAAADTAAADTATAAAAAAEADDALVRAAGQAPGSVSGVVSSGPQLPSVAGPSGTASLPSWVPFSVKNSCSRCGAARVVVRYRPLFGAVASAKVAPGTDYVSSGWFQVPLGQAVPVAAIARSGRVFVHAQCSAGDTGRRWAGAMPFSYSDEAYGCSRGTDLAAVAPSFLPGDPSAPVYELTCPDGCGVVPAPLSGVSAWPSRCVGATNCSVACDITHVGGPMTATCIANTWIISGSSCQPRTINFCPDSTLRDDVACRSGFPTFFGCPCLRGSSAGFEPGCRRLGVCTAAGCSPCTAQEAPTCPAGYTCARALGDCVPTQQLKK